MKEKVYDLQLIITASHVSLHGPGGSASTYSMDSLPDHMHDLASKCLQVDERLCNHMNSKLKLAPKDASST